MPEPLVVARRERAAIAAAVRAAIGAGAAHRRAEDRARVDGYLAELEVRFSSRWHRATIAALDPILARVFSPPGAVEPLGRRLIVDGDVAGLRAAVAAGPVVLAPGHAANLDAIAVGLTLARLGLPAAAYPVGEHLYRNPVVAALVPRLGGIRLDRGRRDPRYLAALGASWAALVTRSVPLVVFPSGTRNRAGTVDRALRLGLVAAALRRASSAGAPAHVIPVAISARIVLEASHLVDYHLRGRGHERVVGDELFTPGRLRATARRLRALDQRVVVRLGPPIAVAGRVDVDALAAALAARYQADAVHHDTHLVGAALDELRRRRGGEPAPAADLPRAPSRYPRAEVEAALAAILAEVDATPARGRRAAPTLPPAALLDGALAAWRAGHPAPVARAVGAAIVVDDPRLAWFYGNRLGRG